jgi:hypothetical protein
MSRVGIERTFGVWVQVMSDEWGIAVFVFVFASEIGPGFSPDIQDSQ